MNPFILRLVFSVLYICNELCYTFLVDLNFLFPHGVFLLSHSLQLLLFCSTTNYLNCLYSTVSRIQTVLGLFQRKLLRYCYYDTICITLPNCMMRINIFVHRNIINKKVK